ncbi:MAG: hypothetical protein Q8O67_10195 [Deltaproteobacteria bacterium]|nr:hypothetical protein [Deltaproteobacteria bacterium]
MSALPVSLALALSAGCPEPPAEPKKASLILDPAKTSADVGTTINVSFTSRGADGKGNTADVVATLTVDPAGDLPADLRTEAAGAGADTLTITPNADGEGSFVVGCVDEGTVTLTITTAGELTQDEEIRCRVPDDFVFSLDPDVSADCARLQGDGASSCEVVIEVERIFTDGTIEPASDVTLRVEVFEVADVIIKDDVRGIDPDGNPEVLAIDPVVGAASDTLDAIATDENGNARFFVRSSDFGLAETVSVRITLGTEDEELTFEFADFEDLSEVTLAPNPGQTTSGETVEFLVTATDTDETGAAGRSIVVTLPTDGVFATVPAAVDNKVTVVLDDDGEGSFTATAPTVGALTSFTFTAEFQAIPESQLRTASATLDVNVAGSVTGDAALDRDEVDADGVPQRKATLTLKANQGAQTFNGVTATVRVGQNSRAVLKLENPSAPGTLQDEDTAVFTAFVDGVATVDIIADSDDARGLGILEVEILRDGVIVLAEDLTVDVARDPVLQSIIFEGSDPATGVIGVQGSPLQTTAVLTFRLLDDSNEPVAGSPVIFVANASDPLVTDPLSSISGADGTVIAIINAGQVAGPVTVTATATFGGRTLSASSLPIAIIAGVPNSAISFLKCDATAQFDPFGTDCSLTLADRFTNRVDAVSTNVQFRAEGGNIGAVATSAGGVATSPYAFAAPGAGSADIQVWSYAPIRNIPSADAALIPECFDRTTRSPCDLIEICTSANANLRAFCPLPPATAGAANGTCLDNISPETLAAFATQGAGDQAINYEIEALTNLDTLAADVDAQVAAYAAEHRACGFPLSCLQGNRAGLLFDGADDCPVNAGCLDYSSATECPQNGLIDILASVNGEEAFDDVDGDGIHDDGIEDFVDFPEPFLDKNSSCSFDDLNENPRLQPSEKIQLSDIFIDDVDGVFGFDGLETNGIRDISTEISFKTTIVHLAAVREEDGGGAGRRLQFGERAVPAACGANGETRVTCDPGSSGPGVTSRCEETARDQAIAVDCGPTTALRDEDTASYVFRWSDANGNCPSVNFAETPVVTATGPIKVFFDAVPLDTGSCGVTPGGIGTTNIARPWCEEHAEMGAPVRSVDIEVDCAGLEGVQSASLDFALGGSAASQRFAVTCPTCGDNLVEGEETCDDGNAAPGDGCDAACLIEAAP